MPGLVSSTACTRPAQASALLILYDEVGKLDQLHRIWFM